MTKALGENDFKMINTPFFGLHPIFNVEFLKPYFPPLLDALDVANKFTHA